MAIKKCKECGADVSTKAKACRLCGAPVKKGFGIGHWGIIFIVLLALGSFLMPSADTPFDSNPPAKKEKPQEVDPRTLSIKRQFSSWDGSHYNLTKYIKQSMHDPSSYDHIETTWWDMQNHIVVITRFRGKNAFGAVVKNIIKAKVDMNGNIQEIIESGAI